MRALLQLSLIATLLVYGVNARRGHHNRWITGYETCNYLEVGDLHIPDNNTIVKGEKENVDDSWYTYIDWLENPIGDLTLSYKMEFWFSNTWHTDSYDEGTVDVYSGTERPGADFASLVLQAMGLPNCDVKIPGKLRVSPTLFNENKCWKIKTRYRINDNLKFCIFLKMTDDEGHVLLTGHLKTPEQ